jgi:hypothetical protein
VINNAVTGIGRRGWAGGALLIVLLLAAYLVGRSSPTVSIHTAVPVSAATQVSVEADGWTYDVPLQIPWYDAGGGEHVGDRPACLPPTGTEDAITFGTIEGSRYGQTWRAVVWVECP